MPTPARDLFFAPAVDLAAQIRTGDLSPVELMRATLERIEAINLQVNAIVSLRPAEQLLADAQSVADRIAHREDVGPLAGLPLGVKDLEDTIGLPNTHGSLLFKDFHPERDTVQVARLKRAVEPGTHARRLERWLGGGAGGRVAAAVDGLRRRRLGAHSGELYRALRTEAYQRPHSVGPGGDAARVGHHRQRSADPLCA